MLNNVQDLNCIRAPGDKRSQGAVCKACTQQPQSYATDSRNRHNLHQAPFNARGLDAVLAGLAGCLPVCLQHPLSSMYLTLVNQKFPEDHVEQLQAQLDAITQL